MTDPLPPQSVETGTTSAATQMNTLPHHSTAADIAAGVVAGAAGSLAATALEAAIFKKRGATFGDRFKNAHVTSSVHTDTALFGIVGGYVGFVRAKSYNKGIEDGVATSGGQHER